MPSSSTSTSLAVGLVSFLGVAAVIVACGSEGSEFDDGQNTNLFPDSGFAEGGGGPDVDLYANDPPPRWCGPAGGPAAPPMPGGTEECPDDKNKPGCACSTPGETAPCWTGLRKHRNLGICKDGVTECKPRNETSFAWGPCEGQVLPDTTATKGPQACMCFSQGKWQIDNLSPCFVEYNGTDWYGVSTVPLDSPPAPPNSFGCPEIPQDSSPPPSTGGVTTWSTNSLNVDCAGTFELCYTLKAGAFKTVAEAPEPLDDCVVAEVCTTGFYPTPNVDTPFPPLKAWVTDGSQAKKDCVKKWETESGGYGEMSVKGESVLCDKIGNDTGGKYVFNRVKYCPTYCNPLSGRYDETKKDNPECQGCLNGASGVFD